MSPSRPTDPPDPQDASHPPEAGGVSALSLVGIALVAGLLIVGTVTAFLLLPGPGPDSGKAKEAVPGNLIPATNPAVGKTLPEFSVVPLAGSGDAVTLKDLAGKVVLVNFWGPWCPPCRIELPHVAKLGQKYRSAPDFRLLAVCSGPGGREDLNQLRDQSEAFLIREDIELPAYLDPQMVTRQAFDKVGRLKGFPTTFVMDRQGVIRNVWVGYAPEVPEQIDQWVAQLLAEKAP